MARAGPAGAQARQAVVGRNAGVGPALSCRSGPGMEAADRTRFCIRPLCDACKLLLLPHHWSACRPSGPRHTGADAVPQRSGQIQASRIAADRGGCNRVVLAHHGRSLAIAVCNADLWTVGAFSDGAFNPRIHVNCTSDGTTASVSGRRGVVRNQPRLDTNRPWKKGSGLVKMQEREEALAERGHLRALEVNLAIERHQQLHSLQLPVVCRKRTTLVNKLVGKVLDSVPKNFQSTTGLRVDPPPPTCARADGFSGWRRHCY